ASPRGDPPGFVRILDDATLLLPDRLGNNRLDTYSNLFERPGVGILFMVPGIDETLRVNGRARVLLDDPLLAASAVEGKPPRGGLLIEVDQVFFHCGKPLKRARLWDEGSRIPRDRFPTLGRILAEQTRLLTPEAAEQGIEAAYRTRLY
ncbi:MAG: pyridoxamine 5'-phosphate oxidase family protein, partial [Pseudomonadota bacterium]|nr:pyridoxamine 5'-phosphate oxidase family protein [Pseudomonadota bacterium]